MAVVQYLRGLDLSGIDFKCERKPLGGAHQSNVLSLLPCFKPSTEVLAEMCRLNWLRLHNVGLSGDFLPKELKRLSQLESLSLSRNALNALTGIENWPQLLPNLRKITCRKNQLCGRDCIPSNLFECPNLQVVDFSHNQLTQLPKGIDKASGLLVLNMSHNYVSQLTTELFIQCTELMFLDLSYNQLENLPAQLRRCNSLQELILSNNPLKHAQLRSITALKQLEVLNLSATERRLDNFPTELDRLERLVELDISYNGLPKIPDPVLAIRSLRKLNLAHNELTDLSNLTGDWPKLEYLNLGYNQLTHLPTGITRLSSLRKLYVNNNKLTFGGIPSGVGKLGDLEVLDASYNELENVPESLCRCGSLKRLKLNSNRLLTLPDATHYLRETLDVFEVENNPQLRYPPKPPELKKGAGLAFYNIDFSLDAQLRMMRGKPAATSETKSKDPAARLRRLRRRRGGDDANKDSKCVLEGMQRMAKEKDEFSRHSDQSMDEEARKQMTKRWQDLLTRPRLDYGSIFEEETGTVEGLEVWELDQFYPKRVEDDAIGHFFNGDCYIILHTRLNQKLSLEWSIYYWIGSQSTMDKQTCAAIHSVNLRNFLGAENRIIREEQGDESPEFLILFDSSLIILEGAHGETGFIHVEEDVIVPKLYRLFGTEKRLKITSVPLTPISLDPKYVYLLDAHSCLHLWLGLQSRSMIQTKGRLLAENISVRERRGVATIHIEPQSLESNAFWAVLTGAWSPPPLPKISADNQQQDQSSTAAVKNASNNAVDEPIPVVEVPKSCPQDYIPIDWELPQPMLYDVHMGKGYLELPQVALDHNGLSKRLLCPKHVYILNSGGQLFLWFGEKSSKFLRFAGYKLALQLLGLMPTACLGGVELLFTKQPELFDVQANWCDDFMDSLLQTCTQGAETQIFKYQFCDWEDAIAVDFTRTAESVARRGVDMNEILEKDKITTDLRALLAPREKGLSQEEAMNMMNEWNVELIDPPVQSVVAPSKALQQFVFRDGKWLPVEQRWFGHLFNKDSYILVARYWDFDDDDDDAFSDNEQGGDSGVQDTELTKTVVYFWQGREASELDWLTFNFSVRIDMQQRLSQNSNDPNRPLKVEFKRVHQQQEDIMFLVHFQRQLIIHSGQYKNRYDERRLNEVQMYYLRANGNLISTRCIEIEPSALCLNSCFNYIIKAPAALIKLVEKSDVDKSRVFIWLGNKSSEDDKLLAQSLAERIFEGFPSEHVIVPEGTEPDLFWIALGGKKNYDKSADFLQHGRLFRLSNEQGYFCVSEKCSDFCQDDLASDDVMLLDTGMQIYLWWSKRTSDVEKKLSLQAAKMYQTHLRQMQADRPRQLKLTVKHAEPHQFRRCFHGWGMFREPKDWSG